MWSADHLTRGARRLLLSFMHAEGLVRARRTGIRHVAVRVPLEENAVRFDKVWNKLLGQHSLKSLVAVDNLCP